MKLISSLPIAAAGLALAIGAAPTKAHAATQVITFDSLASGDIAKALFRGSFSRVLPC